MAVNSIQQQLVDKDKRYIWHPFTQMKDYANSDPIIIERGRGVKLIDISGNVYYDGVSSLWLNIHGHQVPEIDEAITAQLSRIAHSTLLGLGNVPSIYLAEKIIELAPGALSRVFYSDSGSEAVEIGLKIAYQYWQLKGETRRKSFVAMTNAYHGDTIGATSVGGIDLFHATYKNLLFKAHRAPYPYPYRFDGTQDECAAYCLGELERVFSTNAEEIIGLIVEPVVQGAAGMIMMPDGFMKMVRNLCRKYGVLLLADEVATGFGRTGAMFACSHDDVDPDIMMVAKGLTGGYLPLAATLVTDEIYAVFLGDYNEKKTFFHGHSYTGNQLGCAAALANIRLLQDRKIIDAVVGKSRVLTKNLRTLEHLEHVGDIRIKGFMVGIELVRDRKTKEPFTWEEQVGIKVCDRCRELGMIIRPLGNVVVLMPPLASSESELTAMIDILKRAVIDVTG